MAVSEEQIVPFTAAELRGEKLLVLAPHPDDEVIGCGGLIALHAREKRQIRVLIATDGAAAASELDADYAARRERESASGLQELGGPTPQFLRFRDRQLDQSEPQLREILKSELREFAPDLIATPSPIEIHPDHIALTRALIDLIQSDEELVGDLAVARIAFYEVSQPIQPNVLVDITDCAEAKYRAIAEHTSQKQIRDYEWFARGLNQYRSMTLFPASRYAEAYHVREVPDLRTEPWTRIAAGVGGLAQVQVTAEPAPISVVIRTRNRRTWLQQAIESVQANATDTAVIVVNDGGSSPADLASDSVTVIDQVRPVGRSEAMNIGVRSAGTPFIAFLDDDDLYYPEHLKTLGMAALRSSQTAYYSDAISSFHEPQEDGSFRETARLRLFAQDFDRELLLFDNYIPLPTVLVRRDDFLGAGGFDPKFDLLEDWDFLIRLARRGPFLRIPRVTCEIRHFRGSDSAILNAPEESRRFREAKLRIWKANADQFTPEVIANVFERQKKRMLELFSQLVERRGLARHLERDVTRLDREKTLLLEQLQNVHADNESLRGNLQQVEYLLTESRTTVGRLTEDVQRYETHVQQLNRSISAKDRAIEEKDVLIGSLFTEIQRLNDLLEAIYRSRTWKLHQLLERITGRGE